MTVYQLVDAMHARVADGGTSILQQRPQQQRLHKPSVQIAIGRAPVGLKTLKILRRPFKKLETKALWASGVHSGLATPSNALTR